MAESFDPYHQWLGIPAGEQPPNYYRLLGIPLLESSDAVIENAANQRMGHLRTFQTGKHSADSQRLLNEVAAARVCLLRPEKKAAYDQELRKELAPKAFPTPAEPINPALAAIFQSPTGVSTIPKRRDKKPPRISPAAVAGLITIAAAVLLSGLWLAFSPSNKSGEKQTAAAEDGKAVRPAVTGPRESATSLQSPVTPRLSTSASSGSVSTVAVPKKELRGSGAKTSATQASQMTTKGTAIGPQANPPAAPRSPQPPPCWNPRPKRSRRKKKRRRPNARRLAPNSKRS